MKRRRLFHILMLSLLFSTPLLVHNPIISHAETTKKITLLVNTRQIYSDNKVTYAQAPIQIKHGVTYVPLRALGDVIGATTVYDSKTKNVTLTKDGKSLRLKVNSKVYSFDNKEKTFPIGMPFLDKQTTMLPLRTIAEHFGATVTPKLAENKIEVIFNIEPSIGNIMMINGREVLNFDSVNPIVDDKQFTLIRNNSPEQITQEGIYYKDKINGDARILVHQQNSLSEGAKMYVIAENKGDTDSYVTLRNIGLGGPNPYTAFTGKESVGQYLSNFHRGIDMPSVRIPAGSKKVLIPELSDKVLRPKDVITMYADIFASSEVSLEIIALKESSLLDKVYPSLQDILRDGKHTRGTFSTGNREISVSEELGAKKQRLLIGDGEVDPYIQGVDKMTGLEEINYGNRGMLYKIHLKKVAPNTTIVFNGRGGSYAGSIAVNENVIRLPDQGVLSSSNEGVVLYRTKNIAEEVLIYFIPASGSDLPVNLLFYPLDKQ
ncbi:copper amine oxidase N-terminal domain-containing protein [Cytobacillus depressus]|uniref:Copper amine oxidase N-terminal domain-containing protein n=1 Tax=Cytobacillus depressus TaxID=1602942 RepID=A0A6L3V0B6_9BACI|nr:copper amine oxidase N-terminal domain-containing protein [Cytobacillus depressus]KAB2330749.1 copper amine oxidase N-terminal domain-containing protein [Cytobacillus depressus]